MQDEKYYVYVYRYPKNYPDQQLAGTVFYVGKGQGGRIIHHERQARQGKKSHKCNVIREIWQAGYEVDKEKLRFFHDEDEAFQFEQDLILSLGKVGLTNLSDGKGGTGGPRPNSGRPKQYIKVPVETFIGEGTKIEVFSVSEKSHFYHIEGQGITTVDDIYRGSTSDLLSMLLEPIGLTIDDHRIIPASPS